MLGRRLSYHVVVVKARYKLIRAEISLICEGCDDMIIKEEGLMCGQIRSQYFCSLISLLQGNE